MKQTFTIAATALALALPLPATANSFAKLTPETDDTAGPVCPVAEPSFEVVVGFSEVRAYMAWWERLDLERRLEAKSCDCEPVGITWDDVSAEADPWLDLGKVTADRTINDLRQEGKDRRAEMDAALTELRAEVRTMCGTSQ